MIGEYWAVGQGRLFDWRIRVSHKRGCKFPRGTGEFGERMLVSAARNVDKMEKVRLAADHS